MARLSSWLPCALTALALACLLSRGVHAIECSECSLIYEPVVHTNTGTPFFNECLGRCQLGEDEEFEPAATTVGEGEPGNPLAELIPVPVNAAELEGVTPTLEDVTRFQAEGYLYAGRPGFGATTDPADALARQTSPTTVGDSSSSSSSSSDSLPDTTYLLRIVFATGDLYVKTLSRSDMEALVRQADDPESGLAARAEPNVPRGYVATAAYDEYDEDGAEGANNTTASSSSRGSSSRRMLSGLGVGLRGRRSLQQTIRDCPACGGGAVCRCITGEDNRKQATNVRYPLTAVAYLTAQTLSGSRIGCSGTVVGAEARTVITAAHCVYDRTSRAFYSNFVVTPGQGLGGGSGGPYGSINAVYADVKAEYRTASSSSSALQWDTGVLGLETASPGGSMGVKTECGSRRFRIITAGYPADKTRGTMWRHIAPMTMDMCASPANKEFGFDVASGQSGSGMWHRDKYGKFYVRLTISYAFMPGRNGAVAVTPATWAWLAAFMEQYGMGDPAVGGRTAGGRHR